MTKEEIVRKCAKQAGFVIGQHGYGMIEHAVNLAWDAALASRSDVSRDSIIEDCAAICDRLSGWEIQDTAASRNARSAFSHAARQIRALKRPSNSPGKDQP